MPESAGSDCNSLVQIDSLLDEFAGLPRTSEAGAIAGLLRSFAAAILRTEEVHPSLWTGDPIGGLFLQDLTHANKRFVAVCLLRLLSRSDLPFKQNVFRANAYHLFDAVLTKDVYPEVGLTPKQQTFEKEAKLRDLAQRTESDVAHVLDSLTSLEPIHTFRQSFMRALNGSLSKAILWPFLPRSLLDVRLSELFIAAKEYTDETGAKKFRALRKALETIERYEADVMSCPTKYARSYLASVATKLAGLLKHDFDANPLSQPATLVIKPLDKKYPLREPGKLFPLVLSVLNEGPGYASNVFVRIELTDDIEARKPDLFLGDLEPGASLGDAEIPCMVVRPQDIALGTAEVSWTNVNGIPAQQRFDLSFDAQRSDIPWSILETEDPYSLQPVITADQLVGRAKVLNLYC